MLELLQPIETPGFQIATWVHPEPIEKDGKLVHAFGRSDYHPVVQEFIPLCCETSAFIDPYKRLPEDPDWLNRREPETTRVLEKPADMETATLDQIRRYLVILARGERFCGGYIDGQFESGCLQAAIKRLRELRAATGGDH